MSFNAGLSGVAAANKDLAITGNNIANASTTGFKGSRAEFGDAYASSVMGMGQDMIGSGVNINNVGQKFEQGTLSQTKSALDLGIDGNGFFVTTLPDSSVAYTRSGIFGVDKDGYVVSNQGGILQGFGTNQNGIVSGVLTDLRIDAGNQAPRGTHGILAQVNVPANASAMQSVGSTTRTNGLAIGVAQVGPDQDVVTSLDAIGFPTTAGSPSQLLGGPVGFSGSASGSGITFPWQPTAAESAFSIEMSVMGPNINAGASALTDTIQPFADDIVYEDVNDLVDSINANIDGNPNLGGKVHAVAAANGSIRFETLGTYATDGSNITGIVDSVGGLSTRDYLNFGDISTSFVGSNDAGLNIVAANTATVLTGSANIAAVDSSDPFLDAAAGLVVALNLAVDGQATLAVSLTVPAIANADAQDGWANKAALIADLNGQAGVSDRGTFAYDAATDRLSFTANGTLTAGGAERVTITTLDSLNTSPISFDDLGLTSESVLAPNLLLGQVRNDTLQVVTEAGTTEVNVAVGTYADADALAVAVNTGLAAATLGSQVQAYAADGIMTFTRIDAQVAGDTLEVNTLVAPTGAVSTTAEQYWGLDLGVQVSAPTVVGAIAGGSLFANDGFIDLSSDPGVATSVQGNNTTELSFAPFEPGTATVLTGSVPLPAGPVSAVGGALMSFSMNIGAVTDTVTLTVPTGPPDGWPDNATFISALESQINAAPNFVSNFGTDAITLNQDPVTRQLNIVSNDAGIGPVEISIVDQTSAVAGVQSTVNPTSLGLATVSSPVPTRVFGSSAVPANNVLEISVDGGATQLLAIPEATYLTDNELVTMVNSLIDSNPNLTGEVEVSHTNGRLVFQRTDIGAFPLDLTIDGSAEALAAFGLTSSTKITGEEPVDRSHSFRVNLAVPLPDAEGRSGSVAISLDEKIYSLSQLASSINRELAAVPEDEYIGVLAVVARDEDDNEVLQFRATEAGEASQISVSNVLAPGEDLDVNAISGLLQADRFDSGLLNIGEPGITNGYPEQSLVVYDAETDVRSEVTIPAGSQASEMAAQLSGLSGITATAETQVRVKADDYVNSGDMDVFINGQIITADDYQGMVDEINSYTGTSLNSISASLDADTGDILIESSIGIDISLEIESPIDTDGVTVQGADGTAPVTLGRGVDSETNARIGGYVDIVLNEGHSMIEPEPRVAGLFNGLSESSFEDYVINAFDPDDPETYNEIGSLTTYDSLGNQHQVQLYYVKDTDDPAQPLALNSWTVYAQIDGENVGDPDATLPFPENREPTVANFKLHFNADGTIDDANTGEFLISNWDPVDETGSSNGAYSSLNVAEGGSTPIPDPNINSNFTIDFGDSTQYGGPFARYNFQQDGYASGRLQDLEIDTDGSILARYTNGEAQLLGQVALASFANMEGLTPVGQTSWKESFESGDATIGEPGTGLLGNINSATLEDSTVDLSEQLVHLIIAQRNYQASAKTIETANAVTQTIINLR